MVNISYINEKFTHLYKVFNEFNIAGYLDSSMAELISHIDGFTEKDDRPFGKISRTEMHKIKKLPYVMKTCMVMMQRAVYDGYEILPGIESRNKLLKDIVMVKGDRRRYFVVRFEPEVKEMSPTLKMKQFISEIDRSMSLPRLFYEYRYAKAQLGINEYVLCTNGYFEDRTLESDLECIEERDPVVDLNGNNKSYKIVSSVSSRLKSLLKPYLMNVLADRIIRCLMTNCVLEEDDNSYFLKTEIIDVEKSRLKEEFLNGKFASEYGAKLKEELNLRFGAMALLGLPRVEGNKINLAWDFGSCNDPNSGVYEKVDESELKTFLNEFTVATHLPRELLTNTYFAWKIGTASFEIDDYTERTFWKHDMKTLIDWLTFGGKSLPNQKIRNTLKQDKNFLSNWSPNEEPLRYLVGRNSLLLDINKRLKNGEMLILTGMGGIGKSQLVNMYYKKFGIHRFDENIVWLHAEDKESLTAQFYDLTVNAMCIYDEHQAKSKSWNEIMKEIMEYYEGKKWLLVYDGALPFIFEERDVGEERFLPEKWIKEEYPNIIITSRKQTWEQGTVIKVPILEEDEAKEAIVRNVNLRLDKRQAQDGALVAKAMGYFPMAVYHSITYINKVTETMRNEDQNYDFTFEEFLKEFSKHPEKCFEYQQPNQNRQLYSKTILEIWNSDLEEIDKEKNGDKILKMFHLAAFLKNDPIPQEVFLDLVQNDKNELKEMIEMLKERSMVQVDENGSLIIHEVFRKALRIKISNKIDYKGFYDRPRRYYTAYELAKSYFAHKVGMELIDYEVDVSILVCSWFRDM